MLKKILFFFNIKKYYEKEPLGSFFMQFILLKIPHFYERNASLISSGDGSLPILGLHPLLPKPSQIWTLRRGFHFRKCNAMLPVSGTSTIFHPGRRKFFPYIFCPPPHLNFVFLSHPCFCWAIEWFIFEIGNPGYFRLCLQTFLRAFVKQEKKRMEITSVIRTE